VGDVRIDEKATLKLMLEKRSRKMWSEFSLFRMRSEGTFCEHGKLRSESMNSWSLLSE